MSRLQQFCNLLVFGLLAALGVWGHCNHWQLRRHAEVPPEMAAGSPAAPQPTIDKGSTGSGEPARYVGDFADESEPANQQVIQFRSRTAVDQAGIRIERARIKDLDEYVVATGGVVGYDETRLAQLSSRVPGIAWRVEKHVGDEVHKGEILAILDSIEVGNAKARYLEAAVEYDVKSENVKHLEQISGSIPARTLREARGDAREARIRRYNARQTLINLGLPLPPQFDVAVPDEELMHRIQFLGIPPDVVAELDPSVATANLLPIVAPFDGVLIDSQIVMGEVVQTANQQFVMADVTRMWLKISVKKGDAVRLAPGQQVLFRADGVAGELESVVSWIGTEVDEKTRTVQVRAIVDNPLLPSPDRSVTGQRLLRAHTFGTSRIRVREKRPTVVVPHIAIQWDGQRHLVFIPKDDGCSFKSRVVIPGGTHDGYTEIITGLAAEEPIVTSGSYVLKSELGRALPTAQSSDAQPP